MCNPTQSSAEPTKVGVSMIRRPNSIESTGNKKPTVTIRNLIYREEWEEIESACEYNPYQAEVADKLGDLPLHEACMRAAPLEVIQNLISAYPDGVKKKGFCDRLPLHYASYNNPSLHVINLLLQKYPEGVSTLDSDGRLPLHLAVVRNAPKQAIQVLISAFPRSLQTPNKFGSTPQMLARTENIQIMLQDITVESTNTIGEQKFKTQEMNVVKRLKKVGNKLKRISSKNEKKRKPLNTRKSNNRRIQDYSNDTRKISTPDKSSTSRADRSTNNQHCHIEKVDGPSLRASKEKSFKRISIHQRSNY